MEIAQKLIGLMQFKKSDTKNKEEQLNAQTDLRRQIEECKALIARNETIFNMERDPEMIDAHIFERESLMVRYSHLIRQAKLQQMQECAAITKNDVISAQIE